MPVPTTPLLAALATWPAGPGSSRSARRATLAWAVDPVLGGLGGPGAAAVAVAGHDGGRVLAALAGRSDDGWAATAALAGMVTWLAPITARWARGGMPGADLEAAEADLVAGCLTALAGYVGNAGSVISPDRVAQVAWHRVHNTRRTDRARVARRQPLPVTLDQAPGPSRSTVEEVLAELTSAVTAGLVSADGAAALAWQAAGWPDREAAARAGVTPEVLRARRSRTLRRLATGHGQAVA